MGLIKKNRELLEWSFGAVPLSRKETHEKAGPRISIFTVIFNYIKEIGLVPAIG